MLKRIFTLAFAVGLVATSSSALFAQEEKTGYHGVSRTLLWSTSDTPFVDTTKYKKDGPYVIGFSNASISNSWRVGMLVPPFLRG